MILFADSARHYGTAGLGYKWVVSGPTISSTEGRSNGPSIRSTSGGRFASYVSRTLIACSTMGVAFRYKQKTNFTGGGIILSFWDGSTEQCAIGCDTSGHLIAYKNDNSTVLGTSTNTLTLETLCYLEAKALFNGSTGTIEVRVNGSSSGWINLTNVDTMASANSTADTFRFSNAELGGGGDRHFCDIVAWDTTGSINNDFIGETNVTPVYINGAGTYAQWTASTGANYTCVDETTASETDYVSTLTSDSIDSYNFENISGPSIIKAVINNCIAKKDDAGSVYIKHFCIDNSTEYVGSSQPVLASYKSLQGIYEIDPNTSSQWELSGFNGSQFGMKYSST